MISLESKRSKQVDFTKAIHAYLRQYYANDPNAHPQALQPDIDALQKLRQAVVIPLNGKQDVHPAILRDLMSYFCQLTFFTTKFSTDVCLDLCEKEFLATQKSNQIGVDFPWYQIFDSQGSATLAAALPGMLPTIQPVAIASTSFDNACVLFNIAVLYANLGVNESRADTDGIKRSIALFQNAAGCFDHLSSVVLPALTFPANVKQPVTPEFSKDCLTALSKLCLAQAQECSWQKSVVDNLKNGTIAKLAMQASQLYSEAIDSAKAAQTTESWPVFTFPSALTSHMRVKKAQFAAIAQYRKSKDDLAGSQYAAEIGRLQASERFIKEALAIPKREVFGAVLADLKGLQAVVSDNLARAIKDNDLIYLEIVKSEKDLQPIVPALLVKPTVPSEISRPIEHLTEAGGGFGRPLFSTLVPYTVQLAMSIYDSRKDDMLHADIIGRCDQLDAECSSALQALGLPAALNALDTPHGVPASLLDKAEQVRSENGAAKIRSMLSDVARLRDANRQELIDISAVLDGEERQDGQLRQQVDMSVWDRLPSSQVNTRYRQKIQKYWETLDAAIASDESVSQKYGDCADLIQRLAGNQEDIEALLPAADSQRGWFGSSQSSVSQHAATRKLRGSLEDLDTLTANRRQSCNVAKRVAASDDIRAAVLQEAGAIANRTSDKKIETAQFEPLFERQLAKYDMYRRQLEQNAHEQNTILQRVKGESAAFESAKTDDPTQQKRQQSLQAFDVAFAKYREISSNLSEGIKFYGDLANLLNSLRNECQNFVNIRQTEASHMAGQQQRPQIQPGLWTSDQPIRFGP